MNGADINTSNNNGDKIEQIKDFNLPNSTMNYIAFVLGIKTFVSKINNVSNYNDFSRFKKDISNHLNSFFISRLEGKGEDFILAFNQSNISKYQSEDKEDCLFLKQLVKEKNKYYRYILLLSLHEGKLDSILSPDEKLDLINIINSGVFAHYDGIFINWHEHTYKEKALDNSRRNDDDKLAYGGLKDGEIVGYNEFADSDSTGIDSKYLDAITDINLRKYLSLFSTFTKQGITNYDLWVEAEVFETKTWKNKDSIFGLVTPIEDYNFPSLLVEPELILFLKDNEKKFNNSDYYDLSVEFFGDKYGMDNMTLDFVETILEGGESTFSGFIGKAFPNDINLSEREGNSIILKNTDMIDIVKNSVKGFKNLLGDDFDFDNDKLYNELLKEVTYHEFGHSVFTKGHPTSNLEEAKATLFYYLKVFKENSVNKYTKEDISRIVEFTIMDSIRNLERINQEKSFKYVVLTKINLLYLFDSGLVAWDSDKLVIDADNQKFDIFIGLMKDMLFNIRELYKLSEDELKEQEVIILDELDNVVMSDINKMIPIIKK